MSFQIVSYLVSDIDHEEHFLMGCEKMLSLPFGRAGPKKYESIRPERQRIDGTEADSWDGPPSESLRAAFNICDTCIFFQDILGPLLYTEVILRNTVPSGQAIAKLSRSRNAKFVERLTFMGEAPGYLQTGTYNDVKGIVSPEIMDVLENLDRFPSLKTITFDFDIHLGEQDWEEHWDVALIENYLEEPLGTPEEMKSVDQSMGWTALLYKTFKAIASHDRVGPIAFVLKMDPLRPSSAWYDSDVQEWLSSITSFRLEIYSNVLPTVSHPVRAPRHRNFIRGIESQLLTPMVNVTQLTLVGNITQIDKENLPLICRTRERRTMFPWTHHLFPLLQNLELIDYLIEYELLGFMTARGSSLETLTFNNCYIINPQRTHWTPVTVLTWAMVFRSLIHDRAKALKNVHFQSSDSPFSDEFEARYNDSKGSIARSIKACSSLLRSQGSKREARPVERRFPYGKFTPDWNQVVSATADNLEHWLLGHDGSAWEELADMMAINRGEAEVKQR